MTNATRDNNHIPVVLGTSNNDGITPLPVQVNPTLHSVEVDEEQTGSDLSGDDATRDENMVTVMMGVSNVDGVTPTAIYIDSVSGKLLINTM
jgi:hypothetical protein